MELIDINSKQEREKTNEHAVIYIKYSNSKTEIVNKLPLTHRFSILACKTNIVT